MAEQTSKINKIVANALIKNQAIFLPSLGSLSVETLASKLNSSTSQITPPKYVVKFSSEQRGVSLIDIIEDVAGVTTPQAGTIYSEWLDSVVTPQGANIEGVGAIVNKNFNIATPLDSALNPEQHRIIKLKRRRGGWIWIAASIVVCVVVGLGANYGVQGYLSKPKPKVERVAEVVVEPIEQEPTPEELIETDTTALVESPDTTLRLECTTPPEVVENPRYRVVCGVFSTPENAQKGAENAHQTNPKIIADVRPFGDKFMVSIYSCEDAASAKAFIEENSAEYPDLWIYKRRGE